MKDIEQDLDTEIASWTIFEEYHKGKLQIFYYTFNTNSFE